MAFLQKIFPNAMNSCSSLHCKQPFYCGEKEWKVTCSGYWLP